MRRLIIDTDPGVDDSIAIQMALRSPEVRVEALTTVCGNRGVASTTRNALINLEQAGRADVPVAVGAARPLAGEFVEPGVPGPHGRDGLGGCNWPDPCSRPVDTPAARFIADRVLAAPGEMTLLAVAPLTNLAMALALEPRIAGLVRGVVVMGGALRPIPGGPAAEFNFRTDPEAADRVLGAGWPLTQIGLDLTLTVALGPDDLARIAAADTPAARFLTRAFPAYRDWCRREHHQDAVVPHDACALAYVLDPSLFETETLAVAVELRDPATRGRTVPAPAGTTRPAVTVCRRADAARIARLCVERITG